MEGCRGGLFPTGRPTPKADAFCPSQEGIFIEASVVFLNPKWNEVNFKP
jgi:hypothetical protein